MPYDPITYTRPSSTSYEAGYFVGLYGLPAVSLADEYLSGFGDGLADSHDEPEFEPDDLDDWRPALDEPDLECCF